MPADPAQGKQGCEMDEGHEFEGSGQIHSFSPETNPVADRSTRLSKWLTEEGRFLSNNRELLDKFCAKVVEAGVPLSRAWLHIRTLHPEFAGVSRIWRRDMHTQKRFLDFGFEKLPAYLNSPVQHVVEQRQLCRWRLDGREALPFPVLEEHRTAGYVDYAIAPMVFSDGRVNALSWATDRPGGFGRRLDLRAAQRIQGHADRRCDIVAVAHGGTATLISDCSKKYSQPIPRSWKSRVSVDSR
jgi:hypothetical protein